MSYRTTGRGLFDTHLYFYLLAPHPALRLLSAATGTRYRVNRHMQPRCDTQVS